MWYFSVGVWNVQYVTCNERAIIITRENWEAEIIFLLNAYDTNNKYIHSIFEAKNIRTKKKKNIWKRRKKNTFFFLFFFKKKKNLYDRTKNIFWVFSSWNEIIQLIHISKRKKKRKKKKKTVYILYEHIIIFNLLYFFFFFIFFVVLYVASWKIIIDFFFLQIRNQNYSIILRRKIFSFWNKKKKIIRLWNSNEMNDWYVIQLQSGREKSKHDTKKKEINFCFSNWMEKEK